MTSDPNHEHRSDGVAAHGPALLKDWGRRCGCEPAYVWATAKPKFRSTQVSTVWRIKWVLICWVRTHGMYRPKRTHSRPTARRDLATNRSWVGCERESMPLDGMTGPLLRHAR